jgi:hypothetical protein
VTGAFEEKRPTPVTVIGWAWIIIGSLMLLSATGSLMMQFVTPMPDPSALGDDVPFAKIWRYFRVLLAGQVVFASAGVFAGIRFLRLEKWARTALEVASWVLLTGLVSFVIVWVSTVMGMEAAQGFAFVYIAVGIMSTLMYGVPIGLMIHHLRSKRVREAVA